MIRCPYCGRELSDTSRFCSGCGAPQQPVQYQQTAQPQQPEYTQASVQPQVPMVLTPRPQVSDEETKQFVETTRRLLRWEAKAWKITGIVALVIAIVYAAIFFLFGGIFMLVDPGYEEFEILAAAFFAYGFYFLILLAPIAIAGFISASKISYYLNVIDYDMQTVVNRCGSIGMLVVSILFSSVPFVFFLINFVRMKANKDVIKEIIQQQM